MMIIIIIMMMMMMMIIIITRAPSCKLHEEISCMHSRTREDECRFVNAHPASDILRRPPREATWHRSLEILPSIFRENSTRFPRGQRARKIDQKSSRTSIESRSRVTHRGTQNRSKIAPGTLSGRPVLSKSVPKASRERFGSVSERPGEAQGARKKPLWGSPRFFGVPGSPQKIPRREPTFF